MNDVAQAEDIHAKNRDGVAGQVAPPPTRPPKIPLTLRETYDRYKADKGIGRKDMIGMIVEAIEGLQARIGSVDEAAVAALDKRISSLETVIGNALRHRVDGLQDALLQSIIPRARLIEAGALDEEQHVDVGKALLEQCNSRVAEWLSNNEHVMGAGWNWASVTLHDTKTLLDGGRNYDREMELRVESKSSKDFQGFWRRVSVNCADEELAEALGELAAAIGPPRRRPGRPSNAEIAARGEP